jgi:hypothetical protein
MMLINTQLEVYLAADVKVISLLFFPPKVITVDAEEIISMD